MWKIGGGSAAELELYCNTSVEVLNEAIAANLKRDVEWVEATEAHDGVAVIVGGGASIENDFPFIRKLYQDGAEIFALNGAAKFVKRRGIDDYNSVIVDARKENICFINGANRYFLASQVHEDVYDAVPKTKVRMFHLATADMPEKLAKCGREKVALVGGGRTVGLNAISLVYALGYRKIHLFGYDSSFHGDAHHAYAQPQNDNDARITVECLGQSFVTTPWMVDQAEDFPEVARQIIELGVELTVHGEGLLPSIARSMMV